MSHTGAREIAAVQSARARGAIYKLLARCFYAPTQELLDDVGSSPCGPLLGNLLEAFQMGTLEEMLAPDKNGVATGSEGASSLLDRLAQEYARLFEGPGHVPVPPYESVHRTDVSEMELGLVMGPSTVDARRKYGEAGLVLARDYTDLPDHVAVELEFMYYLCAKEADAGTSDTGGRFVKAQNDFLCEHLLKWLPRFCEAIVSQSQAQFYRDLAKLTCAYVSAEAADMIEADTAV